MNDTINKAVIQADPTVPIIQITRDGMDFGFHGCFHEVRPDRIVQTFSWEDALLVLLAAAGEIAGTANGAQA